jgi:N-dimethylarginine dimethylaminohydrolase
MPVYNSRSSLSPSELVIMVTEQSQTRQSANGRTQQARRYLMCRPTYFEVTYSINPWMRLEETVDRELAVKQWSALRDVYLQLGHKVELIEPVEGLPDMVFAANGGLVIGGHAVGPRFVHEERQAESVPFLDWFKSDGLTTQAPSHEMEGEGDYLVVGDHLLAGFGFRSDPLASAEVQEYFGRPVINLRLIDPRYYHLDTALAVLSDTEIAYLPSAFSPGSRRVIEMLFPDAIEASAADAEAFGLNAVSDGLNVVIAAGATELIEQLSRRGFVPWPVELSELKKAGGGAKCCTLELRS